MINPAMIKKGIQVAGQVVDAANTVNTVSKAAGVNQDSIFAEAEKEGKGGPINSVFQAVDTISGGKIGEKVENINDATGGMAMRGLQTADKIAEPVLDIAGAADGEIDIENLQKKGKKMPNLNA